MVRRRHVFYIAGNDPRGVDSYYSLFRRELNRFQKNSSVEAALGESETDPDAWVARWPITAHKDDWQVSTTYEFLRWDDIIAANMARPMWLRYLRAFGCFFRNLANGMVGRVFGASWQYGIVYLYPTLGLVLTLAVPIVLGWGAALAAARLLGLTTPWAVAVGGIAGVAVYLLAQKLAEKYFVIQLAEARLWIDDWAYERRPDYLERADTFARRIVAKARAGDVDEILIVGHSGGGAVALLTVARALEFDSNFARSVPHVSLATLGSLLPLAALHPSAHSTREAIRRVAVEPGIVWIDCQAKQDAMNFYDFDPARSAGLSDETARCNPVIWRVSLKDLVLPERYRRLRWNRLRMHFQFIMANDRPETYDYFMFICGPEALLERARRCFRIAFPTPAPREQSAAPAQAPAVLERS